MDLLLELEFGDWKCTEPEMNAMDKFDIQANLNFEKFISGLLKI